MARRDVINYRFLKDAIVQKYRRLKDPSFKSFKGIPYDPITNPHSISGRIYNAFRELIAYKHLNLGSYLLIQDGTALLEKLYLNLKKDPNLKFLDNPEAFENDPNTELSESYHQNAELEIPELKQTPQETIVPKPPLPGKTREEEKEQEETENEEEEEGEQPETMESQEETVTQTSPQASQQQSSQPPTQPQQPLNLGGQMPQIPQMPQVPMPQFSGRPRIPSTLKSGLKGAGKGMGSMLKDFAGRGGKLLLGPGIDALAASSRASSSGFVKGSSRKVGLAFAGAFILLMIVGVVLPGVSPEQQPSVVAAPIIPPGNIASCSFTRADQTPKAGVYKSPALLGYFQEASAISTVPAVVLAAFARVEYPSLVNKTDADLITLSNPNIAMEAGGCPKSETGALGVMQLQPPGTTSLRGDPASCDDCINAGAKLVGKTVATLTETDYCNVRTSVIVASGFLLKKLQFYGYGDGTKWDSSWTNNKEILGKLGEAYYGCTRYGAPKDALCSDPRNIYGYGDDILASVQACKATSPSASSACPVPGSTISTASYNADPIRGHCNPDYQGCRVECRETGRRAKAIDVRADGKDVILPTVQGQPVRWTLINPPYSIAADDGGGWGYTFRTSYAGNTWYADMLHLLPSSTVVKDGIYASGHIIGKVDAAALQVVGSEPHVHVTIGKNLTTPVSPGSLSTDCDPGWLSSDFMCQ